MTAGNGLYISEPEPRERGAILISDEDSNDIAEFFHNEHATVDQSYETALALAQRLVGSPAQGKQSEPVLWQWQAPNSERWLTEEGEGSSDPDIRERLILLGYKFRPLYAVLPAEGRPDWKALDNLEDAAEAIFKILSPGLPYTAEDAFWYRQAAHAVLERCSPAVKNCQCAGPKFECAYYQGGYCGPVANSHSQPGSIRESDLEAALQKADNRRANEWVLTREVDDRPKYFARALLSEFNVTRKSAVPSTEDHRG
jgi:hypothetical protein